MRQVACFGYSLALAVFSLGFSTYIRQMSSSFFVFGPTMIMQAVQEMSTPFKDSTLSCGCAPIQMRLDEIVCSSVMDS